jgi:hypothetical protein
VKIKISKHRLKIYQNNQHLSSKLYGAMVEASAATGRKFAWLVPPKVKTTDATKNNSHKALSIEQLFRL